MTTTALEKTDAVTAAIGPAVDVYNRLNVIRSVLAPDLNDQELQLFAIVAERSRLDPFAKQIYAIKRGGRVTFQTGIDGFRSSAEETGEYRGSDEPEFGPDVTDGNVVHPEWARVVVHREFASGKMLHQPAKVFWTEFYPGGGANGDMYRKMPKNQLAKCAEAAAFRKAFPKRFSDVYTPEEMAQADAAADAKPVGPTVRERVAERRAQLEASTTPAPAAESSNATKSVLEAAEDVAEGLFTAAEQVDPATGEIKGDDLVTRLRRVYYAHFDEANTPYSGEQKQAIRELFAGVDPTAIGTVVEAAFNNKPVNGRFTLSQAEAIALLEIGNKDRDLFIVEVSSLAAAG